jgi:hypothetical protein
LRPAQQAQTPHLELRILPKKKFEESGQPTVREGEAARIDAGRFAKHTSVLPSCGPAQRPMWRREGEIRIEAWLEVPDPSARTSPPAMNGGLRRLAVSEGSA